MKNIVGLMSVLIICGCSETIGVKYVDTPSGCSYSETYRPKKRLADYFGRGDVDLSVDYSGVKCETIIKEELKDSIHKTPYNGVPVINERPPLKVDVEQN